MPITSKKSPQPSIQLDEHGLRIDGVFHPLVAGEFEYWRNNDLYWRKILSQMRKSGLELVSTFVCWDFHEIEKGNFDFTGRTHPQRDLARFIDLCGEEGFKVLIRVGPNIDAEWPTRGPAPDVTPLERLHPKYLERTRHYIQALGQVLVPRLHTRGGPIVLLSIDNEAYFPYSTGVASDPTAGSLPVPYAHQFVMSKYKEWLKQKYTSPEALTEAWSIPDLTFDNVEEPNYRQASLTEALDSFDFISDILHEAFVQLKSMCIEAGIDLPIYTNMKQFTHYINWRALESIVDSHGLNLHMSHLWPGDQRLVASWYCRLQRALVKFPWAAEFQGGTSIKPPGLDVLFGMFGLEHNRFTSMLAMTLGLRGICYYMFVERDDCHWCPISPIGKVRPNMAGFQDAIRVLKQLRPDTHFSTLGLIWSLDHHRSHIASLFNNWQNLYDLWIHMSEPKELAPWWRIFRQLHDSDIDFDIAPMDQDLNKYKVLIYAGPDFARKEDLERLKDWLNTGGTLIVTTAIPTRTLDGADMTDLSRIIRQAPTTTVRAWGMLEDVLTQAGLQEGIRAQTQGVWTFAYCDEKGWSFFIANISKASASADIKLGPSIADDIHNHTANDLLTGKKWKITHDGLWDNVPVLAPNEIRCVRVVF